MKTRILSALVFSVVTATAHAGQVNVYDVQMNVQERNQAGRLSQLLMGWDCTSSSELNYKETMRDHQGKDKIVEQKSSSGFSGSTAHYGHASGQMRFEQNLHNKNPNLGVSVTQRCSKSTIETRINDEGELETYTDTESFSKTWSCDQAPLPQANGETLRLKCDRVTSQYSDFGLEALAMRAFQDNVIEAKIELKDIKESFLYNNCGSNTRNARVIHVDQGLGGRKFENDFVLKLKVEGETVEIPTRSGLLAGDILYCSNKERLEITASGVEKDLIWDDVYNNQDDALRLGSNEEDVIKLQRLHRFRGGLTSGVRVQVQPYGNVSVGRSYSTGTRF